MSRSLAGIQRRNLWLGLLAGPLAWAIYFTAGYLFVETACRQFRSGDRLWPSLVVVLLTVVTLMVIGYAGRQTYEWWRQPDGPENGRFMAQTGTLLSGLFAFIVLLTGIPALVLTPCTFVP